MRGQQTPSLRGWFSGLFGIAIAGYLASGTQTFAQQQPALVTPGSAVVTGFSGIYAGNAPSGADPFDYIGIDSGGPSAAVIDLSTLGPQGGSTAAPKRFTVTSSQVGQVFGVTLDNAQRPNIYLAATSAYGLSIFVLDGSGQMKRVHQGEPGAQFYPGQFGPPELGGGPGSVWRVDGTTGEVAPFATVASSAYSPASLGGLAFDPVSRQIFVAERSTGLIYRFGLDGTQRGTYDHGIQGRPAVGLAPVPIATVSPVDITNPAFSTENPQTWGFTSPARRVFGLAVRNNRLYYSVAQGPQVWSVAIANNGSLGGTPRIEIEVPSLQDGIEIASIAFDNQGRMYLAERGATTGDYSLYNLANGGQSRVLRLQPKPAGDPSPGLWKLTPETYSIGTPSPYANGNGGVALGYGYSPGQAGKINYGACRATLWSTGERLLDPGDPAAAPGTFPYLDGLQGNAITLVQPQNTPPQASWFIDYDDRDGHPDFRGYMGAIATLPCAGGQPLPPPPVVTCPPGTYYNGSQCVIIPTCPPGTKYQNGQCVYPTCPPGTYFNNQGQCVPPPVTCPPGTFYYQGQCFPIACPPGLIKTPSGQCVCPPGNVYFQGKCVPPQGCPPGMITLPGGICWCPLGMIFGNGVCQPPPSCPPGQILSIEGKCEPIGCPPGQELFNGKCVPPCLFPLVHKMPDGACGLPLIPCLAPNEMWNGKCVPKCLPPQVHKLPDGACGPPLVFCLAPNEMWNGKCVPKCPPLQVHKMPDGACGFNIIIPPQIICLAPKEIFNGKCVDKCPPGQVHKMPDGACGFNVFLPPVFCVAPKEIFNGKCVDKCPPGQVHKLPDGACGLPFDLPLQILCLAPKQLVNGKCLDPCPPNQVRKPDGTCGPQIVINPPLILCIAPKQLVNGKCVDPCPPGQVRKPDGTCGLPIVINPPLVLCIAPKQMVNGKCLDPCPPGQVRKPDDSCGLPVIVSPPLVLCLAPKQMVNGKCLDPCPPNTVRKPDGTCGPQLVINPALICFPPKEIVGGKCVDPCPPNQVRKPDGTCGLPLLIKPQILPVMCVAPKELFEGQCLDACPEGQEHKKPDGKCGPKLVIQIPPKLLQKQP